MAQSSQWVDRIIFSRNATYGDPDDRSVAEVPHTGALAVEQSYQGSWTGEVPGYLSGDYYIFVCADCLNDVYEYNDAHPNVARSDDMTLVRQWIIQPGTLTENTVWSGMLKIMGTVTVPAGVTLTIEPGSILKFVTGGLTVQGTLNALGTIERPIIFTSWADDSAGGDSNDDDAATSPDRGDWAGLSLTGGTAIANLNNVSICYADNAISGGGEGVLARLLNTTLRENETAFYSWTPYASIEAQNSLIVHNSAMIYMGATSRLTLRNCTVADNGAGGTVGNAILTIENTIFAFNGSGFTGWPMAGDVTIRNSDFFSEVGQVIAWAGGEEAFRKV